MWICCWWFYLFFFFSFPSVKNCSLTKTVECRFKWISIKLSPRKQQQICHPAMLHRRQTPLNRFRLDMMGNLTSLFCLSLLASRLKWMSLIELTSQRSPLKRQHYRIHGKQQKKSMVMKLLHKRLTLAREVEWKREAKRRAQSLHNKFSPHKNVNSQWCVFFFVRFSCFIGYIHKRNKFIVQRIFV
jgi:hypothetical protein